MAFSIAGRKIGDVYSPYLIAELSANHSGNLNKALEMISLAKSSGADAVKIQTFTAETMTLDCDKEDFKIRGGLWDGYSLYDLYEQAKTPYEWHKPLFDRAKKEKITLFSSPFDEIAVDFLEQLNCPAYKVASFEMGDIPLVEYIAKTKKPMIISTGMATLEQVSETVEAAKSKGCTNLALLHCISSYPAPIQEANLLSIKTLSQEFGVVVGLSDHTLTNTASVLSIGLGGRIVEKHFIDSSENETLDSAFSIEPVEFQTLSNEIKEAWEALGDGVIKMGAAESANKNFRRSIYVCQDVNKGDLITDQNIKRIRPGHGLSPKYYDGVIGQRFNKDIKFGSPLLAEDINQ